MIKSVLDQATYKSCLIKYTSCLIKVGRLEIIFAESTIKLNFSGVCNCLTIKIFI